MLHSLAPVKFLTLYVLLCHSPQGFRAVTQSQTSFRLPKVVGQVASIPAIIAHGLDSVADIPGVATPIFHGLAIIGAPSGPNPRASLKRWPRDDLPSLPFSPNLFSPASEGCLLEIECKSEV
jgi:hypothetical protein